MTELNWDELNKVADQAGRPLSEGEYDILITKAEATTSSTKKPMIKIKAKVTTPGDFEGNEFFHNITITTDNPNAMAIFRRTVQSFGIPTEGNVSLGQVAALLEGKTGRVKAKAPREYQGVMRTDIGTFLGSAAPSMSPGASTAHSVTPPPKASF